MSFAPLFSESPVIIIHALAAIFAFGLGTVQLLAPKGTISHRVGGYLWVTIMLTVAISSFFISTIGLIGRFSPIHLLSILTLFSTPFAVIQARRGNIKSHRKAMLQLYFLALTLAGLFTFLPGRVMHTVLFGS